MMKGNVVVETVDKKTGNVVGRDKNNVIVLDSRRILVRRMFENLNSYRVSRVKIGDDVGAGTVDDPEEPNENFDGSEQSVLYDTTTGFQVDYTTDVTISYSIFIDGTDALSSFPGESNIQYTSLGLYSNNNILFAYQRFPERTITENVDLRVFWTITYDESVIN